MSDRETVCLGVIPARGGSKGVKDKNIRPFADSSLIAIVVQCAGRAQSLRHTIVSTDSEKIAAAARAAGGDVPFLRPAALAGDDIPIWRVCEHAGRWWEAQTGSPPDITVALQPTSPMRCPEHIDEAVQMLLKSNADAVLSLTETEHTPYKMRLVEDSVVREFMPGRTVEQRQDAPLVYRLAGIAYATRWEALTETQSLWGNKALAQIVPNELAANVDTPLDFALAEFLYQRQKMINRNVL